MLCVKSHSSACCLLKLRDRSGGGDVFRYLLFYANCQTRRIWSWELGAKLKYLFLYWHNKLNFCLWLWLSSPAQFNSYIHISIVSFLKSDIDLHSLFYCWLFFFPSIHRMNKILISQRFIIPLTCSLLTSVVVLKFWHFGIVHRENDKF